MYIHEIEGLMSNIYTDAVDLLPIIHSFQWLDIRCIFSSGLILLTVT
jgi:hypothetical protein